MSDTLLSRYHSRLFGGARRAANRRGARIVAFQTGAVADSRDFDGSFVFELAGGPAFDGVILATNLLSSGAPSGALERRLLHCELPLVSIGELAGRPSVVTSAANGLPALVAHLAGEHRRRRFAFIAGPQGNPEARDREQVVRAALEALGTPLRPELVLPGNFMEP